MRSINTRLVTYLLRKVTARGCPATLTRGTAEGAKMNCFYAWVLKDGEHDFVILHVVGNEARGLRYNEDRSSVDVCVPIAGINPEALQITHNYGNDRVEYKGAWSAVRGLSTGWPYAYLHARRFWQTVDQWLFNRRPLLARRRFDLLREVIALADSTSEGVDSFALLAARHGDRWAAHPDWWSYQARLEDQLELLVEAGDLRKSSGAYRPTGQGLRTLDDADEIDRKHRENLRVQWGLIALAFASAVMAAAQSGIVKFPMLLDLSSEVSARREATSAQTPAGDRREAPSPRGAASGQASNAAGR